MMGGKDGGGPEEEEGQEKAAVEEISRAPAPAEVAARRTLSGASGKATRESNGSDEGCEEIDGAGCFHLAFGLRR